MCKMAGRIVSQLGRFGDELGQDQHLPTRRFITWAMRGMMSAKSVVLAKIARHLLEGFSSLHHAEKKLSRHFTNPRWDHDATQERYLAMASRWIKQDTFIAFDLGEITKPKARAMPYLAQVRDGSKQGASQELLGLGWWKVEVEAMLDQRGKRVHLPLHDHVFSTSEPAFAGQNEVVFSTIDQVLAYTGVRGIWLGDRGFDSESTLTFLLQRDLRFVVRSQGLRNVAFGSRTKRVQQWAAEMQLTPATTLMRRRTRYALRVGYRGVTLPFSSEPITLIVCEGFGQKPLLLLTNIAVGNLDRAVEMVEAYLARWGVEEGCRFVKQTFDLENVRSLSWLGIRRLVLMALWCYGFLCTLTLSASKAAFNQLVSIYPSFEPTPAFFFYRLVEAVSAMFGPPIWAPNYS